MYNSTTMDTLTNNTNNADIIFSIPDKLNVNYAIWKDPSIIATTYKITDIYFGIDDFAATSPSYVDTF